MQYDKNQALPEANISLKEELKHFKHNVKV